MKTLSEESPRPPKSSAVFGFLCLLLVLVLLLFPLLLVLLLYVHVLLLLLLLTESIFSGDGIVTKCLEPFIGVGVIGRPEANGLELCVSEFEEETAIETFERFSLESVDMADAFRRIRIPKMRYVSQFVCFCLFLVATKQLYISLCQSVCLLVG